MRTKINSICYMSMGLLGIYISVYQSIINRISQEFAINSIIAGLVISLHFIGSLVAPIIFGEISDRIGKKSILIIAINIMIVGLILFYLFNSLAFISIGIFIIGCGFAIAEGTISGVLSDVNSNETNRAINISQMFLSIGAVAGPLIALILIELTGRWKIIMLFMILLFGIVLIYFTRLQFQNEYTVSNEVGLITIKLFKEKTFVLLCISIFVYVGIEEGIAFWLGSYFKHLYGAGQLGTFTLSGFWASKLNNKRKLLLRGGLLISLISIILALLWQNSVVNLICFTFVGLGFSAVWPIIISITADNYPQYTGTSMGIMMTSGAGGGIVVPFLMGALASSLKLYQTFWCMPLLILLILVIQMVVSKTGMRGFTNIEKYIERTEC